QAPPTLRRPATSRASKASSFSLNRLQHQRLAQHLRQYHRIAAVCRKIEIKRHASASMRGKFRCNRFIAIGPVADKIGSIGISEARCDTRRERRRLIDLTRHAPGRCEVHKDPAPFVSQLHYTRLAP